MTRGIITRIRTHSQCDLPQYSGAILANFDRVEGWQTPMPFSEFQAESGLPNAGQVWTEYVRAFS